MDVKKPLLLLFLMCLGLASAGPRRLQASDRPSLQNPDFSGESKAASFKRANFASFDKSCSSFESGEAFVKFAVTQCLNRSLGHCEKRAKGFFEKCNFGGNFSKMAEKSYRELFLMMVLGKLPLQPGIERL